METKDAVYAALGVSAAGADAVVLAAGDYPVRVPLLTLLGIHARVVCCDSAGADFVERESRAPWAVVGDLDSIPAARRETLGERVVHVAEQETNDLSKAVHYAARQGCRRLVILGATGRREDHTLGNISLLIEYLREGLDVRMATDHGVFIPCRNAYTSPALPVGTQVSIFSFGARGLQSTGLRYALHDLRNLWEGTLNETTAETFSVTAEGDFLVFVNV